MYSKALFLDRDGVINIDKGYVIKKSDFVFDINIFKLIKFFKSKNFLVFIVTNQSGVARGYFNINEYSHLNNWMLKKFEREGVYIDKVYSCFHHPEFNLDCECRKPKTGMLKKIENDHAIELKGSFFIGDALSDIELATNYGLEALLVRTGHGKQTEKNIQTGSLVFENLLDAVQEFILIE